METSELIKEAKQGSAAAQKCLFDQWAEKMLLVCRRYVKNSEDAEELLLDGFYKFFKKIAAFNYQGDAALYVWLKRIMINECLMFLRKKNVKCRLFLSFSLSIIQFFRQIIMKYTTLASTNMMTS